MADMRIALIGPMGVGKTTVAKLLAERLGLEYRDIDTLRWPFFAQQPDYDPAHIEALYIAGRQAEAFDYIKPFEARFVLSLLGDGTGGIFDFGAGYTVYDDPALFSAVQAAFAACNHVIFLRYSPNADESLDALRGRHGDVPEALYEALNRAFIQSPCNEVLATAVIDTKGKTAEVVAALTADIILGSPAQADGPYFAD